jgi:hypothetical protein
MYCEACKKDTRTTKLGRCYSCVRREIANRPEVQAKRRVAFDEATPIKAHDRRKTEKVPARCEVCGEVRMQLYRAPSQQRGRCQKCAARAVDRRGKPMSLTPEQRQAWSDRSRIQVMRQGGVPNAKKFTREQSGSKHYNWKGGVTPENQRTRSKAEYVDWRRAVFVRDGFVCQVCRAVGGGLHAHHIRSFSSHPELRLVVENGITLCKECHLELVHGGNSRNEVGPEIVDFFINGPVSVDWLQ